MTGRSDLTGVRGVLVLIGLLTGLVVAFLAAWPQLVDVPELREQLVVLYEEYKTILRTPPDPLTREDYRPLAEICWELISESC